MEENSSVTRWIRRLVTALAVCGLTGLATYSAATVWPLKLLPATGLIAAIGVGIGSAVMSVIFMDSGER